MNDTPPGAGDAAAVRTGGCLCGAVRYRVTGPLRDVLLCHCEQCRRTSGHYVAATRCRRTDLVLDDATGLRWYESSPGIARGFCSTCGSSLFWQRGDADLTSIMAGTLDAPTGLRISGQIHTAAAGDYYRIDAAVAAAEADGPPPAAPAADPRATFPKEDR